MADKKTEHQGMTNPEAQGTADLMHLQGMPEPLPDPQGAPDPLPDPMMEKVKIKLHKDKHNTGDVYVAVNGRRFQIQRGVEVEVPRYVVEALENSMRQDDEALDRREKINSRFKE